MINEIGSEFCFLEPAISKVQFALDASSSRYYVLSGRTALDLIASDLLWGRKQFSICLPSYCCESMILPFEQKGIEVSFYPVTFSETEGYPFDISGNEADVYLLMDYFGFVTDTTIALAKSLKQNGKTIIYDQTHSFFSNPNLSTDSFDYRLVSFRKWFASSCCFVEKSASFQVPCPKRINTEYLRLKDKAMQLKREYLLTGKGSKEEYLSLFHEAESLLDSQYRDYGVLDSELKYMETIDYEKMIQQRKANAEALATMLNDSSMMEYMLPYRTIQKDDVPLFFPVRFSSSKKRDAVRRYLCSKNVYCPVHWPVPALIDSGHFKLECYNQNISLVCDQRYTANDMQYEAQCVLYGVKNV